MTRCVVFDFDGVLVDSNEVKCDAFRTIFAFAGAPGRAAVDRVLGADVAGDRFEVIRTVLGEIAGAAADAAVQEHAARYNAICEEHAATCPAIPGADAALAGLSAELPLYVVSATPQQPLERILERRGWWRFLRGAYGRPGDKADHIARLARREGLSCDRITVIGDSRRDLEAARALGCRFIGVRNRFNDFDPAGLEMVDDLTGLPARLAAATAARS